MEDFGKILGGCLNAKSRMCSCKRISHSMVEAQVNSLMASIFKSMVLFCFGKGGGKRTKGTYIFEQGQTLSARFSAHVCLVRAWVATESLDFLAPPPRSLNFG